MRARIIGGVAAAVCTAAGASARAGGETLCCDCAGWEGGPSLEAAAGASVDGQESVGLGVRFDGEEDLHGVELRSMIGRADRDPAVPMGVGQASRRSIVGLDFGYKLARMKVRRGDERSVTRLDAAVLAGPALVFYGDDFLRISPGASLGLSLRVRVARRAFLTVGLRDDLYVDRHARAFVAQHVEAQVGLALYWPSAHMGGGCSAHPRKQWPEDP